MREIDAIDILKKTKVPMLFIHGKKDNFVNPEFCVLAYNACASKIKIHKMFDNASHANNYLANEEEYKELVNNFLNNQFN